MTGRVGGGHLRGTIILCLAGVYFLSAMGVSLLSGSVYQAVAASASDSSHRRTALSYVANQLRRGDSGGVAVGDFGGCSALRLTETLPDGSRYLTLIYCCDGQLRELYMEEGTGLAPEDGIPILPLEELKFTVDGPRLDISARADGEDLRLTLAPRTGLKEVGTL